FALMEPGSEMLPEVLKPGGRSQQGRRAGTVMAQPAMRQCHRQPRPALRPRRHQPFGIDEVAARQRVAAGRPGCSLQAQSSAQAVDRLLTKTPVSSDLATEDIQQRRALPVIKFEPVVATDRGGVATLV